MIYWSPRADLPQPLLFDISRAQRKSPPEGDTYWDVFLAKKPTPARVWIRDGISWGYTDPWYGYFRDRLMEFGYRTAPYHVLYPGQPIGRQFEKMEENVGGRTELAKCKMAMVDCELVLGQSRERVTQDADEFCDRLAQRTGSPAILYSRPYFMRDSMEWDAPWYDEVLYYFALYLSSGRERTPTDIYSILNERTMKKVGIPPSRVVAVQTAKMGTGKGYGFQSNALDYGRWMKSEAELEWLWPSLSGSPPPPPPPLATDLFRVTAARGLYVRAGPGTNFPIVDGLPYNYIVQVYEERAGTGANAWARIEPDAQEWVSKDWLVAVSPS